MSDEASVLIHDAGPERDDLSALEVDLAPRQRVETPIPTLCLVLRVVEEERPHEAAQLARPLRVPQAALVLDERHHSIPDPSEVTLHATLLRRRGARDVAMQLAEL